jgi:hypothetical protein
MSWYTNQKGRREAKRAGASRPQAGGGVEISQAQVDRLREKALAMRHERDAAKRAKAERKRERKLARRGTGGPS